MVQNLVFISTILQKKNFASMEPDFSQNCQKELIYEKKFKNLQSIRRLCCLNCNSRTEEPRIVFHKDHLLLKIQVSDTRGS